MNTQLYKRIELIDCSENYVVFLMGIVIHKPFNIFARQLMKRSLNAVLEELEQKKPAGFLTQLHAIGNPSLLVSYWKDLESLLEYARDKSSKHFPAWYEFNETISNTKAVGLWHEIYRLSAGSYSGTYRNCPLTGLAKYAPTNRLG